MGIYVILNIIGTLLSVYGYVLIATAIISWIPDLATTQLGQILDKLTDPYLRIFRRFLRPLQFGGIMLDIAFLVAIIVYFPLESEVMRILYAIVGSLV
jgi:YggT family protein